MQTFYYSLMRKFLACLLPAFVAASLSAQNKDATQGAGDSSAAMHEKIKDSHEGVTIGLDPWTEASEYKEKFPKKSPFSKGVVAIHMSFRNDNNYALKVNYQSIRLLVQLSEENRQELASLSPEEVADTVMLKNNGRDPTAKRIPLPIPIPSTGPKSARDSNWTALRDACQNAGMPTTVVAAHSTVAGLIYFDLRGELDLLQNSHLYLPNIVSMGDNEPLSYFDIALGHGTSE
ncbi:MAG: hypothetical protein WAM58_05875 [Candidatus Acidiferrum sp.]